MEKKCFKVVRYYPSHIFYELNCTNIWEEYDLKSDKVLNIENINGKAYLLYGFSDIYGAIDINI